MDDRAETAILNNLIKTTLDSVKGFEDAAEHSDSQRFGSFFTDMAQQRRQVVTRLREEVRRLGGNPEDDSSLLAAAHRTFLDMKSAITGQDDKAVIEEVERGEDYLKEKYDAALEEASLSPEVKAVILEAYGSVREGHDKASQWKHSFAD